MQCAQMAARTASLGRLLLENREELIERWYERWRAEGPSHEEVSEVALKDLAPLQLKLIAEAIEDGRYQRESPKDLRRVAENLAPESRVPQQIPIEEIVKEYWLLVSTVRDWI